MIDQIPLFQPEKKGDLMWHKSYNLSNESDDTDYSKWTDEDFENSDGFYSHLPGLKDDPVWGDFKNYYDHEDASRIRMNSERDSRPREIIDHDCFGHFDVMSRKLSSIGSIQKMKQEGWTDESLELWTNLFAYFIQSLIKEEDFLNEFTKVVNAAKKPASKEQSKLLVLRGFYSYCKRERKLPTKKQLNIEITHWECSKGFFERETSYSVGAYIKESPIGPCKVVKAINGIAEEDSKNIIWLCPMKDYERPRFARQEFGPLIKSLGFSGLA